MTPDRLNRTEYRLLCLSGDRAALIFAPDAARALWPHGRQPEKKTRTVRIYLETLCRRGHVRVAARVGGESCYVVTPAGRSAAVLYQRDRLRPTTCRRTSWPRLAAAKDEG